MVLSELVNAQIIQNQVQFFAWILGHCHIQKLQESVARFLREALSQNLAGGDIERGEQPRAGG
jgi:hypothetical protein